METENPDAKPERETAQTDKQGGESQKGPAALPPVAEPSHSEAKERDAEEGKDETDREQDEAIDKLAENTELIAQQTKWERMQGIWVRNQFWASLGLGLLTLIVLAYQTYTLSRQLESMESSSKDTQEMIRAMQKQADAAATQANTSQSIAKQNEELVRHAGEQADALKASLEETRKAANAATTQAAASQTQAKASVAQAEVARQTLGASQASARAAEQSASIATQSFNIGERPYISDQQVIMKDFAEDHQPSIEVSLKNAGKTPALNLTARSYGVFRQTQHLTNPQYPVVGILSQGFMEAGSVFKMSFPLIREGIHMPNKVAVDAIKSKQYWYFVYGIVEYDDGAGHHHTLKFCQRYDTDTSEFKVCAEHNESN